MRRLPTAGGMSIHCSEASTTNGFDLRWWHSQQHGDDSEEVPIQHDLTGLRQIWSEETEGTSVSDGGLQGGFSRIEEAHKLRRNVHGLRGGTRVEEALQSRRLPTR
ncbi:hypothetical protein M6B38_131970 [Iris pallida]|uniref:Uncharacterized protein n=1 Tax=Iris pallida TaxID=29817 RepID=A0AAX6FR49_IRIPA|nr:hypothetical protein M6B38_131970 [Iris pallida]